MMRPFYSARFINRFAIFIGLMSVIQMGLSQADSTPMPTTAPVTQASFTQFLTGFGNISASQAFDIVALNKGQISDLNLQPGQTVQKGQALFQIIGKDNKSAFYTKQAELQTAKETLLFTKNHYQQIKKLYQNKASYLSEMLTAKNQWQQAKTHYHSLQKELALFKKNTLYPAPINGTIQKKWVKNGAFVQSEQVIVTLIKTTKNCEDRMGEIAVFDPNNQLRPTQPIQLHSEFGDFTTTVISIAPTLTDSGSKQVYFNLPPRTCDLPTGSFVKGRVTTQQMDALSVPEAALMKQKHQFVVLVKHAKSFKVQPVTIGSKQNGRVAITKGLHLGQSVLIDHPYEQLHHDIHQQVTILD